MNPHVRALYSFNSVSLVGGTIYGLYYGIFLYKHTFSLSVLALDSLFGGFGTWSGYVLGVYCIRRYGYGRCIKLAFGLWATVSFATALLAGHIAEWFIAIAVIKALPAGLFAAANDTIMLREVGQGARRSFFQLDLAMEFIVTIVLPPLVGALVRGTGGYPLAFAVAGCLYLAALFIPARLPKPDVSLQLREIVRIFRRPLYPQQAANRTLASGFNQLNAFVLTILPFLLMKNELMIGTLTSVTAIAAAVAALVVRRVRAHHALRLGFGAHGLRSIISLLFVCAWSAPFMAGWQLLCKLVTPLHDPVQQSMDIHNDSLILGRDIRHQALHLNLLNNTLLMLGSTAAYSLFFVVTRSTGDNQRLVLQGLIISYAGWRLISLAVSTWINRRAIAIAKGTRVPLRPVAVLRIKLQPLFSLAQ